MSRSTLGALAVGLACAGCTAGASSDPALGALMRIEGGQYVPGAFPAPSSAGPTVESVDLLTNTIWPGYRNKPIGGALGASASSAALALSGDAGYWIVTAGVPSIATPGLPSFAAVASFSTTLAPGAYTLEVHAVDASGRFGPPFRLVLDALASVPSDPAPRGELIVSLTWDTESDLDLHVVEPTGDEIYAGSPSTIPYPKPGQPPPDTTSYGHLDFDSNADCVIDGRRREDVIWSGTAPSGGYSVRVDAASLCAQPMANWTATATFRGSVLRLARGVALASDTWGPHDRGAGLLAFQFELP